MGFRGLEGYQGCGDGKLVSTGGYERKDSDQVLAHELEYIDEQIRLLSDRRVMLQSLRPGVIYKFTVDGGEVLGRFVGFRDCTYREDNPIYDIVYNLLACDETAGIYSTMGPVSQLPGVLHALDIESLYGVEEVSLYDLPTFVGMSMKTAEFERLLKDI